ncbi:MAG: VWA domain-containing protein [Armatimonadota bacterium]|nr:VWA domain-containing protein [Armatimonadota bacterium]
MSFQWPAALLSLLLLPLLGLGYGVLVRRRSARAVMHPDVAALRAAAVRGRRWQQHLGAALFGLAVAAALIALARPVASLPVPASNVYVVLSLDVSRSMLAEDIPPNRLEATKRAAVEFVRAMPRDARVGLVTFSSYASLLVPPTTDHERVIRTIEGLVAEFATAIGDGLLEAVYALPGRERPQDLSIPPQAPRGKLPPGTVVLMSDGQSNRGVPPLDAARIARDLQVKVYTVGVGTPEGTFLNLGGRMIWVRLDEETLKEIATVTDGTYHHASTASELRRVYRTLGRVIGWERRPTEVTSLMAAAAAVLLAGSVALSMLQLHRLP